MRRLFNILIIMGLLMAIHTHMTFTNIKCGTKDPKFAHFKSCYIKAVNRTHKYVDVYVNLYKLPIDNVTISFKVMRHDHGYKPFFIDYTFDGCKFLRNQKHPILKLFYKIYQGSSNINHTCPFDHDIIVDHLWTGNIESDFLKYLPMINGDYALFSNWSTDNIIRAYVNLYLRISERYN
ncbi:uncharacterized protein LOC122618091 [Drosophila teissieri]|uniref:uncharacterized protein LOC122618091 n=1 Tax=Drosophila teissieri TaxID=7243 RepID=UPI001CB9D8DE|nr:uncharacterized protein LOC122618091 [Drosophila teissieri]